MWKLPNPRASEQFVTNEQTCIKNKQTKKYALKFHLWHQISQLLDNISKIWLVAYKIIKMMNVNAKYRWTPKNKLTFFDILKYALRLEVMKGTLGSFWWFFYGRYPVGSQTWVAGIEIQVLATLPTWLLNFCLVFSITPTILKLEKN